MGLSRQHTAGDQKTAAHCAVFHFKMISKVLSTVAHQWLQLLLKRGPNIQFTQWSVWKPESLPGEWSLFEAKIPHCDFKRLKGAPPNVRAFAFRLFGRVVALPTDIFAFVCLQIWCIWITIDYRTRHRFRMLSCCHNILNPSKCLFNRSWATMMDFKVWHCNAA